MRYHSKPKNINISVFGETYICDHPVYNRCTLYLDGKNGLAVIQQRYDKETKRTWWTEIDTWLVDDLYLHRGFNKVFKERSGKSINGIFPTMTVRQLMWSIRMKPLSKERWETTFDRRDI